MDHFWWPFARRVAGVGTLAAMSGFAADSLATGLAVAAAGLLAIGVVHVRHLVGLARWLRAPNLAPFPDADGVWGQVFIELARKLRHVERQQQALRDELTIFQEATTSLPDGVVMLDQHNRIVWYNRTARQQLGLNDGDVGLPLHNLVRLPGFAEYLAHFDEETPFQLRSPVDPLLTLAVQAVSYGANRKLIVSFDITQIERAAAIRRDFIANVSHELRTPLTVVNGFLEHLADNATIDAAQRRRFVELMREQCGRMLRLVDDLLTLSRLEARGSAMDEEDVDMPALLRRVLAQGEAISAGRHRLRLSHVDAHVSGITFELESAIGNLVSNAVRYTPDGGEIAIDWSIDGGRGVLGVRDSGIGIAAEHIPRLTERFYRVDKGRSRDSGGTGLGLAIVKHIALRHQAELSIESTPGEGSRFALVFPAARLL